MEENKKTYSPFWAMQFLVICLGIWIGMDCYQINNNRLAAWNQNLQLQTKLPEAQDHELKLKALVQDLRKTGENDPAAIQVLDAFHIPLQAPQQQPASPIAKP